MKKCVEDRKQTGSVNAVFPCIIEVMKDAVFNRGNPIIMGATVKAGFLKVGTPLAIPEKDVSYYFLLIYFALEPEDRRGGVHRNQQEVRAEGNG